MKEKLKQIRQSLNKTQKEMSSFLGLGEITWQNYERGISKPKLETLEKLSRLGFNINWITSNDDDNMKTEKVLEDSNGFNNIASINKAKIFNMLLNELKILYENIDISSKPQNFIENKAFDMTLNISNIAKNDNEALSMVQVLLNNEKELINQ